MINKELSGEIFQLGSLGIISSFTMYAPLSQNN